MEMALLTKIVSNRIDKKFKELKEKKDNALICYVVAGYPDIKTSEDIIVALIEGGADMIEIGIPFSDPIADGNTIQEVYTSILTIRNYTRAVFGIITKD